MSLGWEETDKVHEAIFTDRNLTLNDEISKHLEYKHLLAALCQKHCRGVMPLTYHVNDENYERVLAKMIYDHYLIHNRYQKSIQDLKWILKPSMLNNGDYIKLFNNVEEIKSHYSDPHRLGGDHVIQQYVPNPALINGKKYTFRIPAIFTNYDGIFLRKEGYVNISAYPFVLDDGFKNRKVHITNYVLDGEFAHIEQLPTQEIEGFSMIYPQMSNIVLCVIKGLLQEFPHYLRPQKTKAFELFGFDFLLDQNGKVWLLEINQSPDAPTFEENALDDILWDHFWQETIEDFVLPIALNTKPKSGYANFNHLLSKSDCYPFWRNLIYGLFPARKDRS